jgi:hypothetical protein
MGVCWLAPTPPTPLSYPFSMFPFRLCNRAFHDDILTEGRVARPSLRCVVVVAVGPVILPGRGGGLGWIQDSDIGGLSHIPIPLFVFQEECEARTAAAEARAVEATHAAELARRQEELARRELEELRNGRQDEVSALKGVCCTKGRLEGGKTAGLIVASVIELILRASAEHSRKQGGDERGPRLRGGRESALGRENSFGRRVCPAKQLHCRVCVGDGRPLATISLP